LQKYVPIYKQIADNLITEIAGGKYPVGAKLPTEHVLLKRLGVSRATVISAMNHLEALGMVKRRPRAGTHVICRFPMRTEVEGIVFDDFARFGVEYVLVIDEITRSALPGVAAVPKTPIDGWLALQGRRVKPKSQVSICSVDMYVHPDYADIEADLSRTPPRIYSLIEARHGTFVRTVDQEIRVVPIDARRAGILSVEEGAPGVQILRWYLGPKDKLLEFTIDIHPAEHFYNRTRTHRGAL
jgi:GntR family transcriptional regulator